MSIDLDALIHFFDRSAAVKLLSAQNAPFMIDFFIAQFKDTDEISIPHEQLIAELIEYQDTVQQLFPSKFNRRASEYLTEWCGESTRYLRRYFDNRTDQPLYQLTDAAETAIRFVQETMERQNQVSSSESRIRTIIDTLQNIATYATDDPDKRLEVLLKKREEIETEIRQVQDTWTAEPEHDALVRSQFHFVVDLLRRVLSDFRLVEDSFRQLTREVQQREVSGTLSKGGLLGYILEEEDALKESDYGISFGEFKNILLSNEQENVRDLVREVRRLEALSDNRRGIETLRQMMPSLTNEAEQVNRTVQRLSGSIRRFLDPELSSHLLRVGEEIGEIKQLAMKCSTNPPTDEVFIEVEGDAELEMPAMRDLRVPSAKIETVLFRDAEVTDSAKSKAFEELRKMRRLNWKQMRLSIDAATEKDNAPISLPRFLETHPPESGAIEVLAYVQIAKDENHIINKNETDEIVLPPGETYQGKRMLTVPRVVFRPKSN